MTEPTTTAPPAAPPFAAGYRAIDCTLTLSEELPCTWPGHIPYQHKTWTWYQRHEHPACGVTPHRADAPYQTRWLLIDEHTGTHLDAPCHFIPPEGSGMQHAGAPGDITVDLVPVEQLMGPAAVIDVSGLTGQADDGESPRITVEAVQAWEAEHGGIGEGEVVLFASGWDANYLPLPDGGTYAEQPLTFASVPAWPAPSPETVEHLVDRGVRLLGTDGTSMGPAEDGAPAHWAGLGAGAVFVEAMTRLTELPARGAYLIFLPLKVAHGTGAPGRAIAFVPDATQG